MTTLSRISCAPIGPPSPPASHSPDPTPALAQSGAQRVIVHIDGRSADYEIPRTPLVLGEGNSKRVVRAILIDPKDGTMPSDLAVATLAYRVDAAAKARFKRERDFMMAMAGAHIMPCYPITGVPNADSMAAFPIADDFSIHNLSNDPNLHERFKILGDVAGGLARIHSKDQAHCDVKPDNLFVSEGAGWVGDCGGVTALRISDTGIRMPTRPSIASPMYLPPEGKNHAPQEDLRRGDVWALGLVVIKTLCAPQDIYVGYFQSLTNQQDIESAIDEILPLINSVTQMSDAGQAALTATLRSALALDPERRCTMAELQQMLAACAQIAQTAEPNETPAACEQTDQTAEQISGLIEQVKTLFKLTGPLSPEAAVLALDEVAKGYVRLSSPHLEEEAKELLVGLEAIINQNKLIEQVQRLFGSKAPLSLQDAIATLQGAQVGNRRPVHEPQPGEIEELLAQLKAIQLVTSLIDRVKSLTDYQGNLSLTGAIAIISDIRDGFLTIDKPVSPEELEALHTQLAEVKRTLP